MIDKLWSKEEIKENLEKNDTWVLKGILAIFNFQTLSEQYNEETREHNGVGFNGVDGNIMCSFANQIKRWENSDKKFPTPLSKKQLTIARKKILKYSGQLSKIANKEI